MYFECCLASNADIVAMTLIGRRRKCNLLAASMVISCPMRYARHKKILCIGHNVYIVAKS